MPADVTPRQKKQASKPARSVSIAAQCIRSEWTISRSLGFFTPVGDLPTVWTISTSGSSRHSLRTPWPTMPVAPKIRAFISPAGISPAGPNGRCGIAAGNGSPFSDVPALHQSIRDVRIGEGKPLRHLGRVAFEEEHRAVYGIGQRATEN